MGFLGIGAMEAVVILVIALIIFGPGRLPEIMGDAGRAVRDFRRATRELTGDFQDSVSEVRDTYQELEQEMRQTATDFRSDAQSMADDVNTAVSDIGATPAASSSRRTNRRPATTLDQMAADSPELEIQPSTYVPSGTASPQTDTVKSEHPAPQRSVATEQHADDLLASDDGDDLLSVDD